MFPGLCGYTVTHERRVGQDPVPSIKQTGTDMLGSDSLVWTAVALSSAEMSLSSAENQAACFSVTATNRNQLQS